MTKQVGDKHIVCQNRRARYDYLISDTLEVGLVLTGTEVKSLRTGQGSIKEAYAGEKDGELFLINANIPEYSHGNISNHYPKRMRKILVRKRELNKLLGSVAQKGITLVPISIYFNKRGIAKMELGIATGKKKVDKRETIKERDWQRRKASILKGGE
ncbi:MAG: SsrA-binding protein SmpB [Alphaproteobacteria bacterium]